MSGSYFPMINTRHHLRRRTATMFEIMQTLNWEKTSHDNENYLTIDEKIYRILDGSVTVFSNPNMPLVSIDGNVTSREIIVLDPSSIVLKKMYEKLYEEMKIELPKTLINIQAILDFTINFVRRHLN